MKHAMESYGYRFDTPDRRIVISGDTNPVEKTIEACDGCDVYRGRFPNGFAKTIRSLPAASIVAVTLLSARSGSKMGSTFKPTKRGSQVSNASSRAWRPCCLSFTPTQRNDKNQRGTVHAHYGQQVEKLFSFFACSLPPQYVNERCPLE